jgi:chitodextrinase
MRTPGIINPRADTVAPTVPGSLAATALSTTSISLTWTASTDAVGVYGYQIWRGGIPRGTTTAGVLTYTDTGLTPTTTYEYRVSAYDEAGNMSGLSNIASATTQTPVTNLPPVWQTIAQQELTVGTGFSLNLTAYPSDPEGQPLTITQVSGTLPTGLTYSQSTKIVSGTPTAVEASSVSFRASDGVTSADRVIGRQRRASAGLILRGALPRTPQGPTSGPPACSSTGYSGMGCSGRTSTTPR